MGRILRLAHFNNMELRTKVAELSRRAVCNSMVGVEANEIFAYLRRYPDNTITIRAI